MMEKRQAKSNRRVLPELERKKMILNAALAIFSTYGYETANVDAIAELAVIGKGTIYRHFPSKLELFSAVVERGHEELLKRFDKISHLEGDLRERMTSGLRQFVDFFVEYPQYYRVMMIEQPEVRLRLRRDSGSGYDHFLGVIAKVVKEDIREGNFKPVDPEFAAQIFLALMKLIVERQLSEGGNTIKRDIRQAVEITLKGLEA